MFSISACEAADVSSPMEMAVEVVNGNIFYNSPLEETIRIHLHYITLHQDLTISVLTIGRDQVPRETKQSDDTPRLLLYQVDIARHHNTAFATC